MKIPKSVSVTLFMVVLLTILYLPVLVTGVVIETTLQLVVKVAVLIDKVHVKVFNFLTIPLAKAVRHLKRENDKRGK